MSREWGVGVGPRIKSVTLGWTQGLWLIPSFCSAILRRLVFPQLYPLTVAGWLLQLQATCPHTDTAMSTGRACPFVVCMFVCLSLIRKEPSCRFLYGPKGQHLFTCAYPSCKGGWKQVLAIHQNSPESRWLLSGRKHDKVGEINGS